MDILSDFESGKTKLWEVVRENIMA